MKQLFMIWIVLLAIAAPGISAQVVVTYDSVIVTSFGTHAEHLPPGERVVISYVLDAVPDSDPDPSRGLYADPVVAMWVSFPDLEASANCGPPASLGDALAQTSNNIVTSTGLVDGAFFSCGQITESTPIGGHAFTQMDIEFNDVVGPGIEPMMLSSDALPLYPLSTPFSFLMIFTTAPGITQIKFAPPTTPVTLTYQAIVESAIGPHAALFPAGERIQISYSLSPNAVDTNPASMSQSNYRNAVLNFNVTFPGLGIFGNAGPPRSWSDGQVYVTNDGVLPSGAFTDQVSFWTTPVNSTSLLNGEQVTFMAVNFHDFPAAPATSSMISSDALPLGKLMASRPNVHFQTTGGNTFVRFVLAPSEQVTMLIDEINQLVADGRLPEANADRMLRALELAASSIAKNNTGSACSHLRTFVRRVQDEIDDGTLTAADGEILIDRARTIQDQLGCGS